MKKNQTTEATPVIPISQQETESEQTSNEASVSADESAPADQQPSENALPPLEFRKQRSREEIIHTLTEEDKAEYGRKLAEKIGVLEGNKEAARDHARSYRSIIKDHQTEINDLSAKITRGEETIWVDTITTFNTPSHGMKQCKREDTGDVLWEREMSPIELQMKIWNEEGGDNADEKESVPGFDEVKPEEIEAKLPADDLI